MLAVFLDLETSGLDARKHRILELAFRIIDLESGEERHSYESVICQPDEVWAARDPVSIEVNGFTEERMKQGRAESEVSEDVVRCFQENGVTRGQAVFICQNPSFDRNYMGQLVDIYEQERQQWPYHWLDLASMYWAMRLEEAAPGDGRLPPHFSISKDAIAEHYGLPHEARPHRAINGVDHLILCYRAVVGLPQQSGISGTP